MSGSIVARDRLPVAFPTQLHAPEFWEQLGRTIATFGFLEEVLGKAIFAFSATRLYSRSEIDAAYKAWVPQLERALTDQLGSLTESYGKVARESSSPTANAKGSLDELVRDLKQATVVRNVLFTDLGERLMQVGHRWAAAGSVDTRLS